jgi:hypothetical protein
MSVNTLERLPIENELEARVNLEVYANSLSTLRTIGAIAVGDVVAIDEKLVEELGFDDFSTAVAEMLKTDGEFRGEMEVNNSRQFAIVDGMVRNKKGEPMVDVVGNGAALSARLAEEDKRFAGQAERDACDEVIVKVVDDLLPGESLIAMSYYPKKDLQKHPEIYKEQLGYEEYLAYVQIYSKGFNDTLTGSSLSIEIKDEATAREVLAEHGIHIPEGESSNQWLKHFVIQKLNAEEAKAEGAKIRQDYYERTNRNTETISANQYIEDNQATLRYFYDAYYPSIGVAVHTGNNNEVLQSFANSLLQGGIKLKSEIRSELIKVANSSEFTDEQGHLMNSILRYAVAEEMRKGLVAFKQSTTQGFKQAETPTWKVVSAPGVQVDPAMLLVKSIKSGVEAGRSYSGCAGNIALGEKDLAKEVLGSPSAESLFADMKGKLQEAFGGQDSESWGYDKLGVCRIKGCKTRPGKTKVGPCNICKSCTEKDNRGIKLEDAGDEETLTEKQEHQEFVPIIDMSKWKKEHEQPEPEYAEPIAA